MKFTAMPVKNLKDWNQVNVISFSAMWVGQVYLLFILYTQCVGDLFLRFKNVKKEININFKKDFTIQSFVPYLLHVEWRL